MPEGSFIPSVLFGSNIVDEKLDELFTAISLISIFGFIYTLTKPLSHILRSTMHYSIGPVVSLNKIIFIHWTHNIAFDCRIYSF